MHDQQLRLMNKLSHKTTKREVLWTRTDVEEQYALRLKQGSVLFDRYPPSDDTSEYFKFTVLNSSGEKVDEFSIYMNDSSWLDAVELFNTLARQVCGADQTIDAILDELENETVVGEADEDRIPF